MVDVHTIAGETFVREWYYRVQDSQRHMIAGFYKEQSAIIWNGNTILFDGVDEFFKRLPPTKHTIDTLDAHAIPILGVEEPSSNILVSVTGHVTYGDTMTKKFHQSFVLSQDVASGEESRFFISSDAFRFV